MAELIDRSGQVRREILSGAVAGLNAAQAGFIEDAQGNAPVKSGELRESIQVVSEASVENPVTVGAAKAPYAAIVNRNNDPFWSAAWIHLKSKFGSYFK
jgi:hypothetical protein